MKLIPVLSVIAENLLGYDLLILLAAIATALLYVHLRRAATSLHNTMHIRIYAPDGKRSREEADSILAGLRTADVLEMHDRQDRLYSLFVNLTGIFPLLGILGTVISLLGLITDNAEFTGNFFGALTSTFWGLVFAIIFKFLDGMIAPRIEENGRSVALYAKRNPPTEEEDAL